jgi:hypothetical protein
MKLLRIRSSETLVARRAIGAPGHEGEQRTAISRFAGLGGRLALILAVVTVMALTSVGRSSAQGPQPKPGGGTTVNNPPKNGPPLQPVGVGPMWDMSVSAPWPLYLWQNDPTFSQHGTDNLRINVPSPTLDVQFGVAYTDKTPSMPDLCAGKTGPANNGSCGDFALYSASIEECLTSSEAQTIGAVAVSATSDPNDPNGAQTACTGADRMPGQWYNVQMGYQKSAAGFTALMSASADPNVVGFLAQSGTVKQAPPGATIADTLSVRTKLPKIANIVRFHISAELGDSRLTCSQNQYQCTNIVGTYARTTGPVEMVVLPAAAIQLQLVPYTILYAPPGSNSTSDFKTTATFTLEMSAGTDTSIDNTTSQDSWLTGGESDEASLGLSMGASGIGITDKGTYDFSNSVKWDNKSTATTGQAQSTTAVNGYSVSTTFGESVGPAGGSDMAQIPGAAGSYAHAPFWNDRVVLYRHPQFAVWAFDGKAMVQMMGARGTPQAVDWLTLSLRDLGNCAGGRLTLNIAPPNEPAEILTADQCQGLASLDPFYGIGQSAYVADRGGEYALISNGNYGMPLSATPNDGSQPQAITAQQIVKQWQKATQTHKLTYKSDVMAIFSTQSGSGLTLSGSVSGGTGSSGGSDGSASLNIGLSQGVTTASGEIDTADLTMAITYSNASATTTEQDWQTDGTINDVHTGLVDPRTGLHYLPTVNVYQDLNFGTLMYQDPGAPVYRNTQCFCNPGVISVAGSQAPSTGGAPTGTSPVATPTVTPKPSSPGTKPKS